MTILDGDVVRSLPQTAFYQDDTLIAQITSDAYITGAPEVGVFFIAPPSGMVRLTIGGGVRDNTGAAPDRIFLSPQLFLGDSAGEEVLAPSVTIRGYGSVAENVEFQYGCRVSLISSLTPGALYYIRVMYLATPATGSDQADIAARDLIVIPMP
ncbi:hypothetical protein [Spongiactinospora sp. TRM90649]|uniref:hypothetical protein n=1 Tax=Spongiactinospora sp. TRM90649 TaxID=3031114 RepID=UPI0023F83685|nr:hypothetical protein [Spongiactinospora sp. TRM90649]MDF5758626.1 hypothetical protein [Spongiactinospora sp. TRM90649]